MRLFSMLCAGFISLGLLGSPAQSAEFSDSQKTEIEKIVVDYLLENPDLMRKVFGILQKQDEERAMAAQHAQAQKAKLTLTEKKDLIFNAKGDAVVGNAEGDVTMVEFLDYNCGFCKRAFANMLELMEKDKKLRIVIKEWPVLGPPSMEAGLVAVAVQKTDPSKYWDFHKGMMTLRGLANKESALRVAEKVGLDRTKLEKLVDDPATLDPIKASYALAEELGLTGTPAYVIGEELIPGAVDTSVLRDKIKLARDCGSTSC
ncbi:MAG: DsbA family protein [Cohaesibacter sp.]|nr:DsbA family protein [Cohaesibacter sp.]